MLLKQDTEIKTPISNGYGIGLTFDTKVGKTISIYEGDYPRKVLLDITTWKGISAGAMHYYGSLVIGCLKQKPAGEVSSIAYLSPEAPIEARGLKIQLTRMLTRKDLIIDRGERFKGASPGERIKNFDTKEEVKKAAVDFFKSRFGEGWTLVMLSPVKHMSVFGESVINKESILCN